MSPRWKSRPRATEPPGAPADPGDGSPAAPAGREPEDPPHRPFSVLLASRPPSERGSRARSGLVAAALHGFLGAAAVLATVAVTEEVTEEDEPLYVELVEEVEAPPPPPPPPPPLVEAPPTQAPEVFEGFRTLEVPDVVPPEIPPPSLESFSERDFTGEGVEGGRADGREAPDSVNRADEHRGPAFTPFTVAPTLRNRSEVARALEREYPPLLRDAHIGGTVVVWMFIDVEGRVTDARVHTPSGHEAFDRAALEVAEVMRFTALNRDRTVPVWVSLPVTFQVM